MALFGVILAVLIVMGWNIWLARRTSWEDERNRQRNSFASAFKAYGQYKEFPYAIRRRRHDAASEERSRLSDFLREVQADLTYHQVWMDLENKDVAGPRTSACWAVGSRCANGWHRRGLRSPGGAVTFTAGTEEVVGLFGLVRGRDRHGRGYRGRHGVRAVPVIMLVLGMTACATSQNGGDSATRQTGADAQSAAQPASGPDRDRGPRPLERRASNVPMEKLRAGEKPPQFILFSFDGVGVNPNWDRFLEVADRADARFTALMTGLYFLTDKQKHRYQGPGHRPGQSAVAFGGTSDEVREEVRYLNKTWLGGHEMGTHYVGHFCAGAGYHGDQWKAGDWSHELNEFFRLMAGWKTNNGLESAPEELLFGREVVKGGRTQCLEGALSALVPAWHEHGMTWDSSMAADDSGISWPRQVDGIWEFPIPYVYSPPLRKKQTALDYNFWYTFNGAKNEPGRASEVRRIVRDTYDYMYQRALHGNRAPVVIANHFNNWNGNAFNPATADFMADACDDPETICATYQDVIAWMELQDRDVLAEWQSRPPVAVDAVS